MSNKSNFEPETLHSFKLWLVAKNYSPSTIKNYLSDLYLIISICPNPFNPELLRQHLPSSPRQLSSLNKFFQFALDQKLISQNPLKIARKPVPLTLTTLLDQYQTHLFKNHNTPSTVKNYLSDIKSYINFLYPALEIH